MFFRRREQKQQDDGEKRYVFFVRHGESRWNKAQAAGMAGLVDMFYESDHGLSETGRTQAEDMNQKCIEARKLIEAAAKSRKSSWEINWLTRFIQAETVMSSPYVRAIESAVIGLQDVLSTSGKVSVIRDAREMRSSVLAVDCSSSAVGDQIKACVSADLSWLYGQAGEEETAQALTARLDEQLDVSDVQEDWCPALAESEVDLDERHKALIQRIHSLRDGSSCILVGHSYYFKRFFTEYLSQSVHDQVPDVAASLKEHVVPQCAVVGMRMEFGKDSASPLITEVAPLLGTNLKPPTMDASTFPLAVCTSRKFANTSPCCFRTSEGSDQTMPAPLMDPAQSEPAKDSADPPAMDPTNTA